MAIVLRTITCDSSIDFYAFDVQLVAGPRFSVGILRLANDGLSRRLLMLLENSRAVQYRQDEDKEVTHENKADLPYWLALQRSGASDQVLHGCAGNEVH